MSDNKIKQRTTDQPFEISCLIDNWILWLDIKFTSNNYHRRNGLWVKSSYGVQNTDVWGN